MINTSVNILTSCTRLLSRKWLSWLPVHLTSCTRLLSRKWICWASSCYSCGHLCPLFKKSHYTRLQFFLVFRCNVKLYHKASSRCSAGDEIHNQTKILQPQINVDMDMSKTNERTYKLHCTRVGQTTCATI